MHGNIVRRAHKEAARLATENIATVCSTVVKLSGLAVRSKTVAEVWIVTKGVTKHKIVETDAVSADDLAIFGTERLTAGIHQAGRTIECSLGRAWSCSLKKGIRCR